jgi:hypothetical protein
MSRHNRQRSVEEGRSLLGGTHAMKSVKPSVDILEGLSTGVNMDFSAPHLIPDETFMPDQSEGLCADVIDGGLAQEGGSTRRAE